MIPPSKEFMELVKNNWNDKYNVIYKINSGEKGKFIIIEK